MKRSAAMQFDILGDNFSLVLTPEELAVFRRPIAEGVWGGHQIFLAPLQQRERNGCLDMTGEELAEAYRKGWAYGDGTWQLYSRALEAAGRRAGWQPSQTLVADVSARRYRVQKGEEVPF